jgi:anti-sigma B factor antagonist
MKAVKTKIQNDIAIVTVKGMLMGDENTDIFRKEVKQLFTDGNKNIVLDFSKVSWINSHGVGALMACYASASTIKGQIVLSGINDKVRKIMTITKVHTLFDTFSSVKEAIRVFNTD